VDNSERNVLTYINASGNPFREWRDSFTDRKARAAIAAKVTRLSTGNFGDAKSIGGGVSESRIFWGPGLRIYYGVVGDDVVLLCGGDKSTQDADATRAKAFWADYESRTAR